MTMEELRSSRQALLQVKDFREYFEAMGEQAIRHCIRTGAIPIEHIEQGRRLYVNRLSLLAYLEGGKDGSR